MERFGLVLFACLRPPFYLLRIEIIFYASLTCAGRRMVFVRKLRAHFRIPEGRKKKRYMHRKSTEEIKSLLEDLTVRYFSHLIVENIKHRGFFFFFI